ncbi:hypothetical protein [Gillisia sp. JM1]|uniref:hypothetical protein n=1 Tax=Gillisia sp. JM1 TaxID=1283286 RepID=UPI000418F277|nr:hypothetical protein [Gillisia sp. JM1]
MNHKTIFSKDFKILDSDYKFNYQKKLTVYLDKDKKDFDKSKLNEIVLWKVNRYSDFDDQLISLINSINPNHKKIDLEKTKRILTALLKTKGVRLAMASTILRFRNNNVYQIIDQRVYRIIYTGQELKLNNYLSEKNIKNQIEIYLKYLKDLKKVCANLDIPFENADRILYIADKRINKVYKLRNN